MNKGSADLMLGCCVKSGMSSCGIDLSSRRPVSMEAIEASMSFYTILQLSSSSEWMLDDSCSHQNDFNCRFHKHTVTALS